ncbi:ABC transporter permease subunit [Paenibacillus alkalitolerans]|uniref:ABC transporter permease subunit n=1 Tax=Paenibacillus alkalitolerans TaxID=2799335 RepID=UPI0018F588A1|nr:ABC transporter permease subunit [Paenibacillus alkalitolerans]
MPKWIARALTVPIILAFTALISVMPVVIQPSSGGILLNVSSGLATIRLYIIGLITGESWLYYLGKNEYGFLDHVQGYIVVSFGYVTAAALAGLTLGILAGVLFSWTKSEWWKRLLELTSVLPDFVVIILLQFLVVYIVQQTGIVVFKVASVSSDSEPAIMLPLLSMVIVPALYVTRNVALHMRLTLTEDYIANAKARGLPRGYIYFFHALPNVFPFIRADLHKLIGIIMSNLFIVEYLYNLRGVTSMLFTGAFLWNETYQFRLVFNCLATLSALYAVIYFLVRTFLRIWERAFVR